MRLVCHLLCSYRKTRPQPEICRLQVSLLRENPAVLATNIGANVRRILMHNYPLTLKDSPNTPRISTREDMIHLQLCPNLRPPQHLQQPSIPLPLHVLDRCMKGLIMDNSLRTSRPVTAIPSEEKIRRSKTVHVLIHPRLNHDRMVPCDRKARETSKLLGKVVRLRPRPMQGLLFMHHQRPRLYQYRSSFRSRFLDPFPKPTKRVVLQQ